MHIATGQPEDHPTPLPLDASTSPGVAPPTAIVAGQLSGPTVPAGVFPYQDRVAGPEADIRNAQLAGQAAEHDRRSFYEQDIAPLGASYGIEMNLPDVPANAVPPAMSDLYPYSGDEPTPAGP
jgi:hypothetical protein